VETADAKGGSNFTGGDRDTKRRKVGVPFNVALSWSDRNLNFTSYLGTSQLQNLHSLGRIGYRTLFIGPAWEVYTSHRPKDMARSTKKDKQEGKSRPQEKSRNLLVPEPYKATYITSITLQPRNDHLSHDRRRRIHAHHSLVPPDSSNGTVVPHYMTWRLTGWVIIYHRHSQQNKKISSCGDHPAEDQSLELVGTAMAHCMLGHVAKSMAFVTN